MSFEDKADRAVKAAGDSLQARFPDQIASVFWYGAVDIDPKHLVVWVMLRGPAETRPKWFFPPTDEAYQGLMPDPMAEISVAVRTVVAEAPAMVRETFAQEDWPNAGAIRVGFDSDERVEAEGGWKYFK